MTPRTLTETALQFAFGAVRQERGAKHLQVGELIEAVNARQVKAGTFQKRKGFDRTAPSFSGASWTAPAESLIPGDGASMLARDSADRHWVYDPDATTMRDRGRLTRAYPRWEAVMAAQLTDGKPTIVEVGNNLWVFARDTNTIYRTVFDATTGVQILAQTAQTATGVIHMDAVYDGTYVWVLWVLGTTVINAHRYDPASPGTAATATTYQTVANAQFHNVVARRFSAISETAVVGASLNTGGVLTSHYTHSYLDPTTGQAKAAPAPVTTTIGIGAATTYVMSGVSILVADGSGGSWYYALWVPAAAGNTELRLVTVTSATLAGANVALATDAGGTDNTRAIGMTVGYVAANGDRVVYAQFHDLDSTVRPDILTITRYTYTGATTSTVVARGSWIASRPVSYSGTFYFLTGYDDAPSLVAGSGFTDSLQRTMHLRDSDGNIINQWANGFGPSLYHRSASAISSSTDAASQSPAFAPQLLVIGTKLISTFLLNTSSIFSLVAAKIEIDMAATYSRPDMFRDVGVAPGGIPTVWGKNFMAHEAGPLIYPSYIRKSAGAGTGLGVGALYRITDPDGTTWDSSPITVSSGFGVSDTLEVPTLRHLLPNTTVEIIFYAGATTLTRQGSTPNVTTADVVTFVIPNPVRTTDERLYTSGGALSNAPPPHSTCHAFWRGRAFFGQGRNLWFSQEIADGNGLQFNEILKTTWTEGTGDILAICPVDWNYLALFKRDAVAVVSGAGPDGRGQGNYVVQTLQSKRGCIRPASVVAGNGGAFFQDSQTGRICVVTSALEVKEASGSFEDYRTETVTGAWWSETEGFVMFATSAPRLLALDTRWKTPELPFGQGYAWATSALLQACGGCVDNTGPVHIESAGTLRRPGSTWQDAHATTPVDVYMALTTGDLAPAGLQGEFELSEVQFLGKFNASETLQITVTPDYASANAAVTSSITAAPAQRSHRPPNCGRIQAFRVKVEETTASNTAGFDFEGFAAVIKTAGKIKHLNTVQVM